MDNNEFNRAGQYQLSKVKNNIFFIIDNTKTNFYVLPRQVKVDLNSFRVFSDNLDWSVDKNNIFYKGLKQKKN